MSVAESLGTEISFRFTAHGQPLFMLFESDTGSYSALCALSTKKTRDGDDDGDQSSIDVDATQTPLIPNTNQTSRTNQTNQIKRQQGTKRPREAETNGHFGSVASKRRNVSGSLFSEITTPATTIAGSAVSRMTGTGRTTTPIAGNGPGGSKEDDDDLLFTDEEPLFLPETQSQSHSQSKSQYQPSQVLQDAGLGDFERMTQEQLRDIFDDDDEEQVVGAGVRASGRGDKDKNKDEDADVSMHDGEGSWNGGFSSREEDEEGPGQSRSGTEEGVGNDEDENEDKMLFATQLPVERTGFRPLFQD
jgi:hypothetical protein